MQAHRSGLIAILIGAFVAIVPTFALYRAVSFLFVIPLVLGIICIGLGVLSLTLLASHWLGRNAAIIALVLMSVSFVPFGLVYYDSLPGRPIHFILPNGYTGPFALVVDREHGRDAPINDGQHTYVIPEDGILKVRTLRPLEYWHVSSASYADGTPIGKAEPEWTTWLYEGDSGVTERDGREVRWASFFAGKSPHAIRKHSEIEEARAACQAFVKGRILEPGD